MDLVRSTTLRRMQHLFCKRWVNQAVVSTQLAQAIFARPCQQNFSTSSQNNQAYITQQLGNRTLVRISGKDTSNFLQGLLTNDMDCLHPRKVDCGKTLYAFMLNIQGRVLYDLILYATKRHKAASDVVSEDEPISELLMECDVSVRDELIKTLKRYKIRKKVDLAAVGDEYSVWTAVPEAPPSSSTITPISVLDPSVICEPDPRLKSLGYRLVLPSGVTPSSVVKDSTDAADDAAYRTHRYQLGVAEGCDELPPGGCLPLESNAAFLNGVSFNKGCYIGQELTARTHHTGLTRKRIMPLQLDSELELGDTKVSMENAKAKKCGVVRAALGRHGLGLLRIPDTVGKGPLSVKNVNGEVITSAATHIPEWWPLDTDSILKQVLTDFPNATPKVKS